MRRVLNCFAKFVVAVLGPEDYNCIYLAAYAAKCAIGAVCRPINGRCDPLVVVYCFHGLDVFDCTCLVFNVYKL